MANLEKIHEELCMRTNPNYFYTFMTVKSILEKNYLPFIGHVQPFITDHSIEHINRVIEKIYRFLQPNLPISGNPNDKIIDIENLNLLLHAILWHDLGNLYGRKDHQKKIIKIFDKVKFFLYDEPHHRWILNIAEGHSGNSSIEKIGESQVPIFNIIVYPQFLSALLRISDEIDEDYRRVEGRVFDIIPKKSQAYWYFPKYTESIVPVYQWDSLQKYKLEIQIRCRIPQTKIRAKWGKDSGEVTGIEEYIFRVNKINQERIYCNKFLTQNSAFYFRAIDQIVLEMYILDETDNSCDKISFTFKDDTKTPDFFNDEDVHRILEKYPNSS